MATITYKDGHILDLAGVSAFNIRIHPGDPKFFHIHAEGCGIYESIWKNKHLYAAARDRMDLVKYVLEEGKNVKIDDDTNRIVPNE